MPVSFRLKNTIENKEFLKHLLTKAESASRASSIIPNHMDKATLPELVVTCKRCSTDTLRLVLRVLHGVVRETDLSGVVFVDS